MISTSVGGEGGSADWDLLRCEETAGAIVGFVDSGATFRGRPGERLITDSAGLTAEVETERRLTVCICRRPICLARDYNRKKKITIVLFNLPNQWWLSPRRSNRLVKWSVSSSWLGISMGS